ncbi:YibE/F family protein [uncultured Desulfuromonas sp.]|uniref:YibE/F family protein n=1 Tax=uncultured Desulfuromonas sp. TaxID=181013 RepID=UPI002AABBF66|nr:YibE/F family protein [uncultured Desulfuromonas sp.]
MRKKNNLIVLMFVVLCFGLVLLPTGFEGSHSTTAHLVKASVVAVDNLDLRQNLIVKTGTQDVQVELLEGPHKGTKTRVVNPLAGKMEFDEIYRVGDTILVEYQLHNSHIHMAYTRGYYRLGHEMMLITLFVVFIVAVAGLTGAKALLSFVFAALMLWKVLIPLFLRDFSPVPVSLGVVAALTASVSFLVGGWTRKGLTAFLGSFAGLILACILAQLFAPGFHLNGAVRPYAENLLYSGFPHLKLTEIFLAGIFLACSGAVMDLAMDIAASIDEVKEKKPDITAWELFRSGMAVGRSVVGTMTTTLLLAYSGGYTAMLMNFMGQGLKVKQILNMNFVASEIFNVFVGSFGLVAVAPLTAAIGAVLYARWPIKSSLDVGQKAGTDLDCRICRRVPSPNDGDL